MLRQMRPNMDPAQFQQLMNSRNNQQMSMQNDIARKAMQNSGNRNVQGYVPWFSNSDISSDPLCSATQQQQQQIMMAMQQQQQQQSQNQMKYQRAGSEQQQQQSPRNDNAPSPAKRPKLEGAQFNSNPQQGMLPGGRAPQQGMSDPQQVSV